MTTSFGIEQVQQAVDAIKQNTTLQPAIGIILGSGLGAVANAATDAVTIPYSAVPHLPQPCVDGHSGRLTLGTWRGVPVVFMQGRIHFYEGYTMQAVSFGARVLCNLGIHTLLLTNAAGAINPKYQVGDLMAISDHINFMGDNPLRGTNLDSFGPRFPDLSQAYDSGLRKQLTAAALSTGLTLHSGVYAAMPGPAYETPAEIRMLRTLGADAVGMSTVPECLVANHMGVRVAGISCITNAAAGLSGKVISHQDVADASERNSGNILKLFDALICHKPRIVLNL